MRFLPLILLVLPIAELILLVRLADAYGWDLLWYLLATAVFGWILIQEERMLAMPRLFEAIASGQTPFRAIFTSARKMLAGVLLIIPGVLSDVLAVLILLAPAPRHKPTRQQDDGVIEGEWRRE